ncbi:Rep protein [Staphylococcus sp. HMSC063F03]|nr:Rep protein [Staphylococcus sp. HMSC063F05]OHP97088.1 Rep protein [Staphylococcus sp. HMSC063F03]
MHFLKEGDLTVYFYIRNKKEYLTSELFDLTESEKQEINHQVIDEIGEEK